MSELEAYFRERAGSAEQLDRRLQFLARTLPPVNLASFAVVWWFGGRDPWVAALAALFVVHMLAAPRLRATAASRIMWILLVNVAIFAAAAFVAGASAPGWLLFIPPLVPATLVLARNRVLVTLAINATSLLVNIVVGLPLSSMIAVAMALAAFSVILLQLTQHLHLQASEIEGERARSDDLLDALLPPSISKRIRNGEGYIAERYDEASVLFADIVGFTALAERLAPEDLVAFLNDVFVSFDALVQRHGLEKIKTIGDAYMVASGLDGSAHDAHAIADFALDLLDALDDFEHAEGQRIGMRVGIHTGPVVAGIVGTHRFVYDVWGDTVNTAARMESHGVANTIQVSAATRARLNEDYDLEPRGIVPIKNKGDMQVWLLRRRRDAVT